MNDISDMKLDDLLRRDFPGAVADDGFSERVMRALPTRRRHQPWLLPSATLAGGLLAWWTLLPSGLLQQVALEWLAGDYGAASAGVCVLLLGFSWLGCAWALEES
jgi:hypothetical protein